MVDKLTICNSALIKLGAETISDINDNSKRAKLCANQYDIIKRKMLRAHPWNFAIKRVELFNDGNTPLYEFQYQFDLPSDCLKILSLENSDTKFKVEGRKLLCDENEIKLTYIAEVNEDLFDSQFVEVMSLALASDIAYAMNQSNEFSQSLKAELDEMLKPARSFDSQEGSPQDFDPDYWIRVRY